MGRIKIANPKIRCAVCQAITSVVLPVKSKKRKIPKLWITFRLTHEYFIPQSPITKQDTDTGTLYDSYLIFLPTFLMREYIYIQNFPVDDSSQSKKSNCDCSVVHHSITDYGTESQLYGVIPPDIVQLGNNNSIDYPL